MIGRDYTSPENLGPHSELKVNQDVKLAARKARPLQSKNTSKINTKAVGALKNASVKGVQAPGNAHTFGNATNTATTKAVNAYESFKYRNIAFESGEDGASSQEVKIADDVESSTGDVAESKGEKSHHSEEGYDARSSASSD